MKFNQLESLECSKKEFLVIAAMFRNEYTDQAFKSLEADEWESDILLMALEGGFKGWFWKHKDTESYRKYLKSKADKIAEIKEALMQGVNNENPN
jgi:hypothetical protein